MLLLKKSPQMWPIWERGHKEDDFKVCSERQKTSRIFETVFLVWDSHLVSYSHQLNPTSRGCSTWKRTHLSLLVSAGTHSLLWSTSACFPSTWLDAGKKITGRNEQQQSEYDRVNLMSREQPFRQVIIVLYLWREGESQSSDWIRCRTRFFNKHREKMS